MTKQKVLVVEDEFLIADLVADSLSSAGFDVHLANDGAKALERLEADAAKYDALITDINLGPGANGWEVAHRARRRFPRIVVLYVTGDRAREWVSVGVPNSLAIGKPFAPDYVVRMLNFLLSTRDDDRAA